MRSCFKGGRSEGQNVKLKGMMCDQKGIIMHSKPGERKYFRGVEGKTEFSVGGVVFYFFCLIDGV